MDLVILMGVFFIFITIAFIALAMFLPEWLGITGKKAKEVIASHQENSGQGNLPQENSTQTNTLQDKTDK